jgi:hypothetical protein
VKYRNEKRSHSIRPHIVILALLLVDTVRIENSFCQSQVIFDSWICSEFDYAGKKDDKT